MAPDELTADEIYALANAFSVPSAKALLSMTEFPPWAIPIADYTNSLEFWSKIARHVADGVMRDGRRQILAAARARFPYHAAFAQPSAPGGQSPCEGRPLRVLVIGASPSDLPPVRTDQESRAISKAALADRIAVSYAPAARSTDLEKLRSLRPDIVHFVCHGDEGRLLFNDVHGESDPVQATRVCDTLLFYRESADVRLRGVVLAACDGSTLVPAFTRVAETILGFQGALPDPCGLAFAEIFYGLLNEADDLAATAREAAHLAAQYSAACAPLITKLIVRESA
jgi:hypothetical protein